MQRALSHCTEYSLLFAVKYKEAPARSRGSPKVGFKKYGSLKEDGNKRRAERWALGARISLAVEKRSTSDVDRRE